MSEQGALSVQIARSLESAGIPFMIVGSIASITYSQPRFTNDVDIVIDPNSAQLSAWISQLGDSFYASQEMAQEALRHRSMFNIIDLSTGMKVDLIIRKQRPFDIEQLQRRVPRNVEGSTYCSLRPPRTSSWPSWNGTRSRRPSVSYAMFKASL